MTSGVPALANSGEIFFDGETFFAERVDVDLAELDLDGFLREEQYLNSWTHDDVEYVITYIENVRGTTLFTYADGLLTEINHTVLGSGIIETTFVVPGTRNIVESIEVADMTSMMGEVDVSHFTEIDPFASTNRLLGFAHHRNPIGTMRSVQVNVDQTAHREIYMHIDDWRTTAAQGISRIASVFELPVALADTFWTGGLIGTGIMIFENEAHRWASRSRTRVFGTRIVQTIIGSATGRPTARLTQGQLQSVQRNSDCGRLRAGSMFSTGFTERGFGTAALGQELFFRVFNDRVTPTSWGPAGV